MSVPGRSAPTGRASAVVALALGAVGVVLLVAGWVGASGEITLDDQTGFVGIAVAGLVVAGAGGAYYTAALSRSLAVRYERLDSTLGSSLEDGEG